MIEIPENFFEPEVRCDFYISRRMKQTWAAELMVYDAIASVCKKHKIRYFAEVGTLLGAVRHHGFVPWDDDIDLAMPRVDFTRFLEVAHELPQGYRVKSIYTDDQGTFRQFHAVVENYDRPVLEWDEDRKKSFAGCPFICAVDIFTLDYIPEDSNTMQYVSLLYNMAYVAAWNYDSLHDTPKFKADIAALEKQIGGSFNYDKPLRPQLYQLADRIASMTKREDAKYMDYYPKLVDGRTGTLREAVWYDSSIEVPFEFTTIPVPVGYDAALKKHFGEYWRFLMHQYTGHGYPFYADQERLFIMQGLMDVECPGPGPADSPAEYDDEGRLHMDVASCLNQYYVPFTYVMLQSLFTSNEAHDITVYLLHDGISAESMETLKNLAASAPGAQKRISFIQVSDYNLDHRIHEYGGWSELVMYRLLYWDILPEGVKRVLHLDGDMLILGDLAPLYETDFEGADLVACRDELAYRFRRDYCISTHGSEFEKLFSEGTYFNSGVLLMNIKRNRRVGLADTYNTRAKELSYKLPYPDQDLLNIVHLGRVKYAPTLKYNFPAFDGGLLGDYDNDHIKKEVAILHFLDKKPWHEGDHRRYEAEALWWDMAEKSPYADAIKTTLTCVVIRLSPDGAAVDETIRAAKSVLEEYFRDVRFLVADTVGGYTSKDYEVLDQSRHDYPHIAAVKNDIIRSVDFDRILIINEGDCFGNITVLDTTDREHLREVLFTEGAGLYDRVIWPKAAFDMVGGFCDIAADEDYELLLRAGEYGADGDVILMSDSGYQHPVYEDTYRLYAYILARYAEYLRENGMFDEVFTARFNEASGFGIGDYFSETLSGMLSQNKDYESIKKLPIAIQRGMTECMGALDHFAKKLGEAIRKEGLGVIFWDAKKLGSERLGFLMFLPYAAIVGFQSRMFTKRIGDTALAGNLMRGKKFNFLFDHPIYMTEDFKEPVEEEFILSQDETYCRYVRENFPHMAGVYHFPPAGEEAREPVSESVYDISFIGTYNDYRSLFSEIKALPPNYRRLSRRFLLRQRRHPNERAEEALLQVIEELGYEKPSREEFAKSLYAMGNVVRILMYYYREKVVLNLLDAGIAVDVFSRTWEKSPYADNPCLHIHDELPYEDSLSVMAKSKLTLNVMSWHKGGMTERIANAMLNHSVVVSDGTTYLNRNYSDMMLLFDLEDFSELGGRVLKLLSDEGRRKAMAAAAYEKARTDHTWEARARQFVTIWHTDNN